MSKTKNILAVMSGSAGQDLVEDGGLIMPRRRAF